MNFSGFDWEHQFVFGLPHNQPSKEGPVTHCCFSSFFFFFFPLFLASSERLDQMLETVQNYLLKAKKQFNHIYSTSKYISLTNHIWCQWFVWEVPTEKFQTS